MTIKNLIKTSADSYENSITDVNNGNNGDR